MVTLLGHFAVLLVLMKTFNVQSSWLSRPKDATRGSWPYY